jgi:probable rRNA maturation factor
MRPFASRRPAPPVVDILIESPLWQAQPEAGQTIQAAITAAAEFSTAKGELSILLTDDQAIRVLNRDWRGIDKPTNVLSFPASAASGGMLGDIAIAYETLVRECEEEGCEFLHHLAHLAVHGFLHLTGYDHQTDAQADAMEGLERKIMARLNLPDPYRVRDL